MSDTQPIINAAIASTEPVEIDPEKTYVVSLPDDGTLHRIEPTPDSKLLNPRRVSGTSTVRDAESLRILWAKHAEPTAELFADENNLTVTGILNADAGLDAAAGHRDHRVVLKLQQTVAWQKWLELDGKLMDQVQLAELLEDRAIDIIEPSSADMLEIAQSFEASSKAEFKSSARLSSGERQFVYEENVQARAGKGELTIPSTFRIAVRPFEGAPAYGMTARFRYRLREGQLKLGYKLERPEDVLAEAFREVVVSAGELCDTPVILGTPPGARS